MTKTITKTATKVETKAATPKAETIGSYTKACILAGKTVKEVEKAVRAKFPNCGPQLNSIYFYRSKLNRAGQLKKA